MINFLTNLSIWILPIFISIVILFALYKKTPVYENFILGAKGGFSIAIKIIPYLIAIMATVAALRASGAFEFIENLLKPVFEYFKIPTETSLIILTRSLSGSATLGVLSDIALNYGADSYATKLAAVITGSSETTFYVASVYFGSIGIKKFRHALLSGILADITGLIVAVVICRIFFL